MLLMLLFPVIIGILIFGKHIEWKSILAILCFFAAYPVYALTATPWLVIFPLVASYLLVRGSKLGEEEPKEEFNR